MSRSSSIWLMGPRAQLGCGVQALVPPRTPNATAWWSALRRGALCLLRAWHLFSLDAPTVAVTWCFAFARAAGVPRSAPGLRWSIAFLGLATWLCYVGDRVLDARAGRAGLRERHQFYGVLWRQHRTPLLVAWCSAALACAACAVRGLSLSVFIAYAALTACALIYFTWVHSGAERATRAVVAKEAVVATLFALGCVIPTLGEAAFKWRISVLLFTGVFAGLCWLNCVAIEHWEAGGVLPEAHGFTRFAARHLALLLSAGGLTASGVSLVGRSGGPARLLAPCLAGAFLLLLVLDRFRLRLSSQTLRILADLALLTPLAWWFAGELR